VEVDWRVFVVGFIITAILFGTIICSNALVNTSRESAVQTRMANVIKEYEDMQTVLWMSEFMGENSNCIALQSMTIRMNKGLWELGTKIDQYRQVTEEFATDPFYVEQKREFNRQEVMYFTNLKGMKERCDMNQTILSYFYKKKEECPDCDAQSFILLDIKKDLEDAGTEDELALFSFDANTDLISIELLTSHYNITEFPCMVIEDQPYCGLRSKAQTLDILCNATTLSICQNR
jgi:hypothetical protein